MIGLPDDLVVMDLETRSLCDLRREGGRKYAVNPSTEIMAGGFWDGESVLIWSPLVDITAVRPALLTPTDAGDTPIKFYSGVDCPDDINALCDRPWAAHNGSTFDAPVWKAQGLPEPTAWWDTLPLGCVFGLPRGLDAIAHVLFQTAKHKAASLTIKLSKPLTSGRNKGRFMPLTKGNIPAVIQYLIMDVLILRDYVEALRPLFADYPKDLAPYRADALTNERGISFDVKLAEAVVETELAMRDAVATDLANTAGDMLGQTGEEVRALMRSQPKFRALIRDEYGVDFPNLQKGTLKSYLDRNQPDEPLKTLLLARVGESSVTSAKLTKGLAVRSAEDTLQSVLLFHGAKTGRWSGRLVQLHNLPGTRKGVDLDAALGLFATFSNEERNAVVRGVRELATTCKVNTTDILSALIRAVLKARKGYTFAIGDYSGIEARVLMWLSGSVEGLAVFKRGDDPYKTTAASVYGVEYKDVTPAQREAGKVAVLLAGYGGGAKRLGEAAIAWGIDLEEAGTSPTQVVEGWRDLNWLIAGHRTGRDHNGVACRKGGMWKDMEGAFISAIKGVRSDIYKVSFRKWRGHVVVELPSGKPLVYRNARMAPRECFGDIKERPVFTQYQGKTTFAVDTYGGKITENVCQAVATGSGGFLGDALVRMEDCGMRPVLHVHDEVISEVRDVSEFHDVLRLLSEVPDWAAGFPLKVSGFMSERYRKKPPAGVEETTAENGAIG